MSDFKHDPGCALERGAFACECPTPAASAGPERPEAERWTTETAAAQVLDEVEAGIAAGRAMGHGSHTILGHLVRLLDPARRADPDAYLLTALRSLPREGEACKHKSAVAAWLDALIVEVEGMRKVTAGVSAAVRLRNEGYNEGYNEAITDALAAIRRAKETQ